jgi:hypothetical protein
MGSHSLSSDASYHVTNTQEELSTVADKKNTGNGICNINVVNMVASIYIKLKIIYIGWFRVKQFTKMSV